MYSFLAKHLVYPIGDLALGTSVMKYYRQLKQTQWWPLDKLKEMQNAKLQKLVLHAYTNVPYYNNLFNNLGLLPEDIRTQEDLTKLPILAKQIITSNFEDFKAKDFHKYHPILNKTGGSSGEPLQYYITKDLASINWAGMFRGWEWAGYNLGNKRITIGGSSLIPGGKISLFNKIRWALERNLPLSGVHLTEEILESHVNKIIKYKPDFFYGYSSAIYVLTDYCKQMGIDEIQPKAVFTTAEMLLPRYRFLIEEQFQCEVYDQYGSNDGGIQALECDEHNGLHITTEKAIVEIVDDEGNPVEPGNSGRIIVTDLHNYAMPFIRYENGDMGTLSTEQCPCGRGLPLLKSLEGRTSDILKFSNGVSISGPAVTLIFKDCAVKQYQLVQTGHNELSVNIIKGNNYSQRDENHFMNVLKHHAGKEISISINYVNEIPPTKAGKHRFIINEYQAVNENSK
jgi:phenylacetate-CoA ligase